MRISPSFGIAVIPGNGHLGVYVLYFVKDAAIGIYVKGIAGNIFLQECRIGIQSCYFLKLFLRKRRAS